MDSSMYAIFSDKIIQIAEERLKAALSLPIAVLSTEEEKLLERVKKVSVKIDDCLKIPQDELSRTMLSFTGKVLATVGEEIMRGTYRTQDKISDTNKMLDGVENTICEFMKTKAKDSVYKYLVSHNLSKVKSLLMSDANVHLYMCEESINSNGLSAIVVLYYEMSKCEHVFLRSVQGKIERDISIASPVAFSLDEFVKQIEDKIKQENHLTKLANI